MLRPSPNHGTQRLPIDDDDDDQDTSIGLFATRRDGTRAQHVIVIVMTRASPSGSRLVPKLLHTSLYAAPPKQRQMPPKTLQG